MIKRADANKKEEIVHMFNSIARHYDFLNHTLSLGRDKVWRRKAIDMLREGGPEIVLDVATGTGDFAIEALKLNPKKIIGIDISNEMLALGEKKIQEKKLKQKIELLNGDSEDIPFEDSTFDAVTVAFGIRNFGDLEKGLKEIARVLKNNGKLLVLEFSKPTKFPFKQLFNFYFHNILPFIGGAISKDKKAYSYLPESVKAFSEGADFIEKLRNYGFEGTQCIPLTFGVCSIYTGKKSPI
ncbi:bifunctional demethylmenaquinone methyltransferase/2-methoxy-6-polyprenyl-1,4-benzoquinol methylase UbiE [Thermodesulfovibrionales bacterium]|nr:bifunctional demethylmenaquinone methyltransferase/2-methoxy-6-polyprenyl-1,4-benzoquinol methylase UbiE [Thermodesulfovibrionales bacterium]